MKHSPIRDGLDHFPFARCRDWCGRCERHCAKTIADAELRSQGWRPIEEAPIQFGLELEGLTTNGNRMLVRYLATGDYRDRWVSWSNRGPLLDLTHWRPTRNRLEAPGRRY